MAIISPYYEEHNTALQRNCCLSADVSMASLDLARLNITVAFLPLIIEAGSTATLQTKRYTS